MSVPLLEDIIGAGVELSLQDLHTSQVGIVKSFDAIRHLVEVQPMVKRTYENEDGEEVEEDQPVVHNVQVLYQGSGSNRIVFPIEKGSLVLLVHLTHSKDAWQYSRGTGTVPPGDTPRHSLTDCVAVPCLLTVSGAISPTALVKSGATVIYAPRLYLGGGLLTSPVLRKVDLTVLLTQLALQVTALTDASNPFGAAAVAAVAAAITTMMNLIATTVEAT